MGIFAKRDARKQRSVATASRTRTGVPGAIDRFPAPVIAPMAMALEQRFMFDAAGVATGAEAAQQAAANSLADTPANDAPSTPERHELVVVDTSVDNYEALIGDLAANIDVLRIGADQEGLQALAAGGEYAGKQYDAIHVISHGREGEFQLGSSLVTSANLDAHAGALSALGQALTADGDLLLYGCEVGSGIGQDFIDDIAQRTGADVAASTDPTGDQGQGGDWDLEASSGVIETDLPFTDLALADFDTILALPDGVQDVTNTTVPGSFINGFTMTTDTGAATLYTDDAAGLYYGITPSTASVQFTVSADGSTLGSFDLTGLTFKKYNGSGDFDFTITGIKAGGNVSTSFTTSNGSTAYSAGDYSAFTGITGFTVLMTPTGGTGNSVDANTFDSFTVANSAEPFGISSSTYDASTGELAVTGTSFTATGGANNDVDASKITITGEGGETYTLTDTADVDIAGSTFTLTLSATDRAAVNQIFNTDGTSSTGGTAYNVNGAAGFIVDNASGTDSGADTVTVSNVADPTITSATYDYNTNVLTVTGANFVHKSGATNDVDVSSLTLTGEGGATYTLSSASDVEITNGTTFTVTLTGTDIVGVESLLNKDGTSSATAGTTYNIAGADNWMAGATAANNIADTTGNGITVSNYAVPAITSATYNATTNTLVLTGTNFVSASGTNNDIDASLLTITGEGGETYTLTDTSDVDVSSATSAIITLSNTDIVAVEGLLNKDGTTSATAGTTFNIAAADNWMAGAPAGNDVADATTAVTVSNYAGPTVTSASYDYNNNVLTVTGTNFVSNSGAANDVDVSSITITGEGGTSYTLTSATDVDVTSPTQFELTLSGADLVNVESLLNKDGTTSATSGTTFNIGVADNWMTQSPAAIDISDTAGNGITVSNYAAPAITSATYDWANGQLVLTGTNFVGSSGANDDIDASLLTLTGEGGATYTLSDSSDVDVTSATSATVVLSAADQLAVRGLLNKDGTSSDGSTTYNLAGADNWMTGAPAGNDIADATAGITVSNVSAPTVTSATYDYSTNVLTVTGSNFVSSNGGNNDVDVSTLTFTGEGGATYQLTSATDVEITDGTTFSVTLSGDDIAGVESLLNKDGTTSATSGTTFNLAVADNWLAGAAASTDIADGTNAITVSNYASPAIASATYDAANGQLVLTGTNFVGQSGATNDIDASLLTITGQGGATYTLTDSADVEITSATSATITLSATDQLNVEGLLNKDGTSAGGGTTYNISAADNWMAGAPAGDDVADATTGVTVSNVAAPTVTSATYDSDTGILSVTGANFTKASGAANDVDVSTITLTGEGGTHTITSATDVEITSATAFSLTLSGADKTAVDALLDQIGSSSTGGTTYNIAVADNWMAAADPATDIADTTGNGVTVTINPKITSATYDASTGQLVVTGTNIQANGGGADIDASTLTITGEGGETYTLTDTSDVERDSVSQFTITLSATDKAALNQILNKNGTGSTGGTTFNLAAADNWDTNVTDGDTSDTTGNAITVSNVAVPTVTSATYDVSTNVLTVTGTGFLKSSGANNDIDVSTLTITGEGGETYTLTDSSDVEINSATSFAVTLSSTDAAGVEALTQANGTTAASGATYNLAAAEDWAKGADAAVNVADLTGNAITVSNFAAPAVTGVTYDASTGQLVLTGTNFIAASGSANDIDASLLTLTGEGGATYTLTDTADVDITSATAATLTLSATDQLFVEALLNKDGTASDDSTTYNLAAADNWVTGSAASVDVSDATSGVTLSNYAAPTITSATYDSSTNTLTVTGTNFVAANGANNDIDVSVLSLTGPNAASYTLTTTADVDVTSATQFSVTLNATDAAAVEAILSANEATGAVYGVSAADNWLAGAPASTNITDTGGVTVSGYSATDTGSSGTSTNVSQNGGQGQGNAPASSSNNTPAPVVVVDVTAPPPGLTNVGGVDGSTTASVLFGSDTGSAGDLGDPSAGIDSMTIVRNVVTGNDAQLNQFYGAGGATGGGSVGGSTGSGGFAGGSSGSLGSIADGGSSGGLSGLLGDAGGGLSGLANSFLGGNDGQPSEDGDLLTFNDYSPRASGFSAELASSVGMRETALLDALLDEA
ncbi:DUF4347 domain-containing protein [Thalassospira lucentensis]|uniref:DUF4347 domain-containing protein n=1 Tax=Thalassospira lucentensis TaxID=168935 RepID=UPI0003B370E7|nr:DUF4347 domain-containing protein [Thalassospira lucentensis]